MPCGGILLNAVGTGETGEKNLNRLSSITLH